MMRRIAFLLFFTEAVHIQTTMDWSGYENDGENFIFNEDNEWYKFPVSLYNDIHLVDHEDNNGLGISDGKFWVKTEKKQNDNQDYIFTWIHAAKDLDREEQAEYKFFIKFERPDGTMEEADDVFTYTVKDVNDNAPYVSDSSLNHIIREDTSVGGDFPADSPLPHNGIIMITDVDDKNSASNNFEIKIEDKTRQTLHKWDGSTKQYTSNEIFRFEEVKEAPFMKKMVLNEKLTEIENIKSISFDAVVTDCADLSILGAIKVCSDKGKIMKSEPITFNVKVSDVNTAIPIIYVQEDGLPKSMEENTHQDRTIFSVYAEDEDRDVINKVTKFSVISCLSKPGSTSSGCPYFEAKQMELCNNAKECEEQAQNIKELNKADIVTTNLAVDYESLEQHPDHPGQKGLLVVVQALNHVALDPQSSIKEVWVTVHDINEPPRLLSRQPGALHVYENLRNEQVSGGCIESEDPEEDEVGFTMIGGNEYFTIDENGCLQTTSADTEDWIDREVHALQEVTSTGDRFIRISIQAYEKRNDDKKSLKSEVKDFDILIDDENDNGPVLPTVLRTCRVLKKENNYHMVDLNESDKDNCKKGNCGPYTFEKQVLDQSGNSHAELEKYEITNKNGNWAIHYLSDYAEDEETFVIHGDGNTGHKIQIIGRDVDKKTEVVNNVQLNICDCPSDSNGTAYCNVSDAIIGPAKSGFPWWAGLIIGLVCLLLVIATLVATRGRGVKSDIEEKPFLNYEDDITDGLGFDEKLGINPLPKDDYYVEPRNEQRGVAVTVIPDQHVYAARPDGILPRDKGLLEKDFLRDAKVGADNDPTAPPYDSLLTFDYEGQNSDCDLDSLYSGSDYGDHRLDQLDNEFRAIGALYKGQDTEDPYIL